MDVYLQMLQAWLEVAPSLKNIQYQLCCFLNTEDNKIGVKNYMSHISVFFPNKATVKLDNVNTVHSQGIVIILCHFPNWPIIYPVIPVYYCICHPSNKISLCALKFYVGFQKVTSEPVEHCDFVDPQGSSWISPYRNQNNLDYLQVDFQIKH